MPTSLLPCSTILKPAQEHLRRRDKTAVRLAWQLWRGRYSVRDQSAWGDSLGWQLWRRRYSVRDQSVRTGNVGWWWRQLRWGGYSVSLQSIHHPRRCGRGSMAWTAGTTNHLSSRKHCNY